AVDDAPTASAAAVVDDRAIAIVGLACRKPGADDSPAFWRLLRDGVEAIQQLDRATLIAAGVPEAVLDDPHYVRAEATMADVDAFDAAYFAMSPREAQITNPQQRVFLELAVDALEDAGIDPDRFDGRIGVYGGCVENLYMLRIQRAPEVLAAVGAFQAFIGNRSDYLTTRVAYKLGLTGPAVNVQTACSTSLVAIHEAVEALRQGSCDAALAGGISIADRQPRGYRFQPGGIFSPDGHVRAFDAAGAGMIRGHGAGLVVLKRLDDAQRDGDAIRAVIRGTAINNDGRDKIGFTAPSVAGQTAVIAAAQADGDVDPSTVSYVEAHGTATQLGDPIELTALNQAFRDGGSIAQGTVGIGSVKTNIGHLDAAAGVAGVIKTVLALENELIPPSLNYRVPNPSLPLDDSPFHVVDAATPWPRTAAERGDAGADDDLLASVPRRAGVSSFGIGGTNAHAVLEAAPSAALADVGDTANDGVGGAHWLPLSGHTPAALARRAADLADWFDAEDRSADALAQVARTLQRGRRQLAHRRVVIARDASQAAAALRDVGHPSAIVGRAETLPATAFLFPGQGTQHPHMAVGLYRHASTFRDALDRCLDGLAPHLGGGVDLRALLFPSANPMTAAEALRDTALAQPAIFAVSYALAQQWLAWGVRPAALIGHSIGEYVAACVAGVFELEDALRLVALRGRLMASMPAGGMLALALPADDAADQALRFGLDLASVNGAAASVVSGPHAQIAALRDALASEQPDLDARPLHTSHAFHSSMMDPILDAYRAAVSSVARRAPSLPLIANVTGTWMTDAEAVDPDYWTQHLRRAVRFHDGLSTL
ncbi:MAG: type I polyketide synthase, partial [Acidobacteriota bacterium]